MSITPSDVAAKEFFDSSDGYDKDEVRAFLQSVAREQEALRAEIERLRSSEGDLGRVGTEVANVLRSAGERADDLTRAAEQRARATREQAEQEARELRRATVEATARLREEADRYAEETRSSADRSARDQQMATAERIGRLLTGESRLRERLYNLEVTLQGMRGDLSDAAEAIYPDVASIEAPRPTASNGSNGAPLPLPVIDVRDEAAGSKPQAGSIV